MGTRHSSLLPEDRLHGHALHSGADLLQIARALLRQQSPFWSSVLNTLVALVSLDFRSHLLNSGNLSMLPGSPVCSVPLNTPRQ